MAKRKMPAPRRAGTASEIEFVTALAMLGKEDRESYRQLRAEAWALVQANHERQSADEREEWRRNAS